MSRRIKPEKREVKPDDRYNNIHLQMIINRIMLNGKKSLATTMVYDALDIISEKNRQRRHRSIRDRAEKR